jgi:hypothetical protein
MPAQTQPTPRVRRGAYSVAETAKLCGISRARFYELISDGVMPHPIYCVHTKRPLFTADMAALCVRVKETNTAIDGRYVIFYNRRELTDGATPASTARAAQRPAPTAPLMQEMIDTLRTMGVRQNQSEITAAITARCSQGVTESSFETDLRAVFDALRCPDRG